MKKLMLTLVCAVILAPISSLPLTAKTVTVSTPIGSVSYQDDGYTDSYGWFHPYGHYCEHCHKTHVKKMKKMAKERKKALKKRAKAMRKAHHDKHHGHHHPQPGHNH